MGTSDAAAAAGLVCEACGKGLEGHRPQIFSASRAHGYRVRLHFLVADHQLVGQLLQAMFPNLIGNFLVPQIRNRPKPLIQQFIFHGIGVRGLLLLVRQCG